MNFRMQFLVHTAVYETIFNQCELFVINTILAQEKRKVNRWATRAHRMNYAQTHVL